MHLFDWRSTFALACLIWLGGTAAGYAVMASADAELPLLESLPAGEGSADDAAPPEDAGAKQTSWELFTFILGRNLTVYVWLLTGILCAGVSTFFVLAGNGLALGHTIGSAVAAGLPASGLADLLLTHGVLEVGVLCVAGAVGFQGLSLVLHWSESGWQAVRQLQLGKVLGFGVAALALAAGVEAFVTADLAAALVPEEVAP